MLSKPYFIVFFSLCCLIKSESYRCYVHCHKNERERVHNWWKSVINGFPVSVINGFPVFAHFFDVYEKFIIFTY